MRDITDRPDVTGDLPDDVAGLCDALTRGHEQLMAIEARQVVLAAHWIDLHSPERHVDAAGSAAVLPGTERVVPSGADGTPMITEFACAEFAVLQGMHPLAGRHWLRKVANLRHRHPLLWSRVLRSEVPVWKALETARLVGRDELHLTREQANWIDEESFEWISTLPWQNFLDHIERLIIDADPEAAETRRHEAATRQGVWSTQSDEHGLKTIVARAGAGEIIYLTAVIDRLAEILAIRGDAREIGPRRASALGLLAHPAHALSLLAQHTAANSPGAPHEQDGPVDDVATVSDADAGDPAPGSPPESDSASAQEDTSPHDRGDRPSYLGCPEDLRAALRLLAGLGGPGLARLLPPATLYVHVDREAFAAGRGSAHVEGIGPMTLEQACQLLGHRRVSVTPVIDLATKIDPIDGYVFPRRMREHLHLTNPRDVFPFGVNTGRGKDIDHPIPYRLPDKGGPPGQTGLHNAAPMTRFHHRLKTFGRWQLTQLGPGAYLWRSPHHHCFLVDANGTHRVPSAVLPWLAETTGTAEKADRAA
jgi:hypothetical protein